MRTGFVNPGCDLTIYCARLIVDQAGGKIDRDDSDGNRAPRCVYKDIESYSNFVERLLGHVARHENNFKSYLTAEEKAAARKQALDESIKEAKTHILTHHRCSNLTE